MPPWRITKTAAERRGRRRRHAAYACPSFSIEHRVLDAGRGSHDRHQELALLAASFPPKRVERRVHRGDPYPSGSLLIVARETPIGSQEDLLGHVLSALRIVDHALR